MKIKKGFILRQTANRNVVVAVGEASETFNGLITLNETGAFLWKQIQKGADYEDLLKAMLKEYEVSEEDAKNGIDAFLTTAKGAGIIED